ncbi:PD-(D/E)XK nuclease family protein, partial [Gordonia alkanivorans]|uniref:PD-(D/E)XK nuclease family protein n=1 Tax=Gordonia alkanivorans TaxID=84096 RepID=UPI001E5BE4E0
RTVNPEEPLCVGTGPASGGTRTLARDATGRPRPYWKTVIEGIADRDYREDDRSLVIVDYKTDAGVSTDTLEAHWAQLAIYAHLVNVVASESLYSSRPAKRSTNKRGLRRSVIGRCPRVSTSCQQTVRDRL